MQEKRPSFRAIRSRGVMGLLPLVALGLLGGTIALAMQSAARAMEEPGKSDSHDIKALTTKVEDIEAMVRVTKYEPKELEKIGKDFGTTYRFRNLIFQYKQPDKIRLEAKSPTLGSATLILNGATRHYSVPKLHLKNTEDLTAAPGKRQSLLEYGGLLSPDTLRFMRAEYVRAETLEGQETEVYKMRYQGAPGGSHYLLWIDPRTRVSLKREWYNADNQLRATFLYQETQEVSPGIWLPTQIEVRNAEGVVAATTTYKDVKINQGLPDSLFSVAP